MMEKEDVILHHFLHEHPLTLIEKPGAGAYCSGCFMYFSEEAAYGCSKRCGGDILLHEECAEMPRAIRHPLHPHHILRQTHNAGTKCAICERTIPYSCGYCCTNFQCEFSIHLGCAPSMGVIKAAADEEETIKHDSHPEHELRLLRRSRRSCSFRCDACGTIEKGNSYICIICQYWIHESCAFSAPVIAKESLHHHPLSLAFHLPIKYIKFEFICDICHKNLPLKHWVYHCESCSYVAHIKCALSTSPNAAASNSINDPSAVDDKGIIQFPINDIGEELIRHFVIREGGEIAIPQSGIYTFHNHNNPLTLNLIPSEENDQKEKDDDDDDTVRSELICDGCVTPIDGKKSCESSSSSSSDKYYLSCGKCKYFLHWACFHLPPELTSLPRLHPEPHKLILKSTPKLSFTVCDICDFVTNGLFYACSECRFKVDIKCASLPDTIKHAAHPNHMLTLENKINAFCGACRWLSDTAYMCCSCQFSLHVKCVMLPAVTKHRWDKHPLPLTYDANINHPGDFYCDFCEGDEMNPRDWMYHCRECDHSFHPDCLSTASGQYRNIKFGQQYVFSTCHPHPLTHQLITVKPRCDLCGGNTYDRPGFQCASCNFIICRNHKDVTEAVE